MEQHFKDDAERSGVLKRTRRTISIILVTIFIVMAYIAYQLFSK